MRLGASAMILKRTYGIICFALITLTGLGAYAQAPEPSTSELFHLYQRPSAIPYPVDNPYDRERAELGRKLFFDPILSASRTTSCASCHQPSRSWGDGLPLAVGDNHEQMGRRSPTLVNIAWLSRLGWDGSFKDIEAVGMVAITGSANMGLSEAVAIERLNAEPEYKKLFAEVFGSDGVSQSTIKAALATFERTIVSGTAPFDRWIDGSPSAISNSAKRGFELFNGSGKCSGCHSGWAFTDGSYHDIGVGQGSDIGRSRFFPNSVKLRYAFKAPTLRDVAQRGPYMHNGSVKTLSDVIELYDQGGINRPSRSDKIAPLGLTSQQKTDLIAFLDTLTSDDAKSASFELPR